MNGHIQGIHPQTQKLENYVHESLLAIDRLCFSSVSKHFKELSVVILRCRGCTYPFHNRLAGIRFVRWPLRYDYIIRCVQLRLVSLLLPKQKQSSPQHL